MKDKTVPFVTWIFVFLHNNANMVRDLKEDEDSSHIMKHDWTADLLTYWDRLRGTRAAPDRSDVSPRALGGKLPNIFILRGDTDNALSAPTMDKASISAAKQWQFRLAGTRLCTIYGRELRNTRFLSLWHDDVRPWLAQQLHLSGLDYRPLRLEHTGMTLNQKSCRFETLLLPLHETDGSPAWIGSMVALDQPLWLGSDPLISNHMGLTAETPIYYPQDNSASSVMATTGMKSVLQVLLDRHHEQTPISTPMSTSASKNENNLVADTAFARALLPQIEALMPSALSTDQTRHQSTQTRVHSGSRPALASAPLTVADLIKNIHPVLAHEETDSAVQKASHLKLIPGGKNTA